MLAHLFICYSAYLFFCSPAHLLICHSSPLTICSSVNLFICLDVICSLVHLLLCQFFHMLHCKSVHLFTCLYVHLLLCPSVYLFNSLPALCPPLLICLSVHLPIYIRASLFICSSAHLFIKLISLSAYPLTSSSAHLLTFSSFHLLYGSLFRCRCIESCNPFSYISVIVYITCVQIIICSSPFLSRLLVISHLPSSHMMLCTWLLIFLYKYCTYWSNLISPFLTIAPPLKFMSSMQTNLLVLKLPGCLHITSASLTQR